MENLGIVLASVRHHFEIFFFERYRDLEIGLGPWKWHYSIDRIWFHIYVLVTLALAGTISDIGLQRDKVYCIVSRLPCFTLRCIEPLPNFHTIFGVLTLASLDYHVLKTAWS